jgi:hypothetical protein
MAVRIVSVAALDRPTVSATCSAMRALVMVKSTPWRRCGQAGVVQHRGGEQQLAVDLDVLQVGEGGAVAVAAVGVVEQGRRRSVLSDLLGGPGQDRRRGAQCPLRTCALRPEWRRSASAVRPTALTPCARASGASSCRSPRR